MESKFFMTLYTRTELMELISVRMNVKTREKNLLRTPGRNIETPGIHMYRYRTSGGERNKYRSLYSTDERVRGIYFENSGIIV